MARRKGAYHKASDEGYLKWTEAVRLLLIETMINVERTRRRKEEPELESLDEKWKYIASQLPRSFRVKSKGHGDRDTKLQKRYRCCFQFDDLLRQYRKMEAKRIQPPSGRMTVAICTKLREYSEVLEGHSSKVKVSARGAAAVPSCWFTPVQAKKRSNRTLKASTVAAASTKPDHKSQKFVEDAAAGNGASSSQQSSIATDDESHLEKSGAMGSVGMKTRAHAASDTDHAKIKCLARAHYQYQSKAPAGLASVWTGAEHGGNVRERRSSSKHKKSMAIRDDHHNHEEQKAKAASGSECHEVSPKQYSSSLQMLEDEFSRFKSWCKQRAAPIGREVVTHALESANMHLVPATHRDHSELTVKRAVARTHSDKFAESDSELVEEYWQQNLSTKFQACFQQLRVKIEEEFQARTEARDQVNVVHCLQNQA